VVYRQSGLAVVEAQFMHRHHHGFTLIR